MTEHEANLFLINKRRQENAEQTKDAKSALATAQETAAEAEAQLRARIDTLEAAAKKLDDEEAAVIKAAIPPKRTPRAKAE